MYNSASDTVSAFMTRFRMHRDVFSTQIQLDFSYLNKVE